MIEFDEFFFLSPLLDSYSAIRFSLTSGSSQTYSSFGIRTFVVKSISSTNAEIEMIMKRGLLVYSVTTGESPTIGLAVKLVIPNVLPLTNTGKR